MALQKQIIPINFTGGLDQKTDEKLVLPAKLTQLENGVFTKYGRINKRNGYDVLGMTIEDGGTIVKGEALGIFNEELNLYSGTNLYSYATGTNSWKNKGFITSTIIESDPIVRNSYSQSNVSSAYMSGLACYAWMDSRGGVRYSIRDLDTGNILVNDVVIDALATSVNVTSFENNFFIFYTLAADTSLNFRIISKGTPLVLGPKVTATGDVNAILNWDILVIGTKLFFVYFDDTTTITIQSISTAFVISPKTFLADDAPNAIGLFTDGTSQNLWIAYANATDAKLAIYNFLVVQVLAPTTIETIAGVARITGCFTTTGEIFYEIDAVADQNQRVRFNTSTITGTVGTPIDFLRSVGLASKAFIYNGIGYVNVVHQSILQATYFTVSETRNVVAKINPQIGGNLLTITQMSQIDMIDTTTFLFSNQIKDKLVSETGTVFSLTGISSSTINFSSENKFQNTQLGELIIASGVALSYDGALVTEHGFHFFPEFIVATPSGSGGSMSNGTYQYSVTYEWTDNLGEIHRSAPSLPITVVLSGGGSSQSVSISIDTLRITQKQNVRIVVYRTEDVGTTFFQVTSTTNPTFNSTTVDTITFVDTLADTSIVSRPLLYTTGGVIENIAPPASSLVVTYKNRVILSGLEDGLSFWYSKIRIKDSAVEFSDQFVGQVNQIGGKITALGAMDDYIIFFKESSIYALNGEGPNATGTQNDFGQAFLITSDAGCDNPNSVVFTPNGLIFKSAKGIYLLNRSLQVSYIGAPVEDNNSKLLTTSALLSNVNQIRFGTNDDTALVYDYFFDQWGTFTNHTMEDSAVWKNKYVFIRPNGEVWVEAEHFQDNNLFIALKVTTAWIAVAGVKGFQRIWRMAVLGEYKSSHTLEVNIGYNYNPNFEQFGSVDVDETYLISTYGQFPENSPYGFPYGQGYSNDFPLYQFKTHMTHQKCEAVRFSFNDNQLSLENFGEGFNICAIALECGIKGTMNKMAAKNSFATVQQ